MQKTAGNAIFEPYGLDWIVATGSVLYFTLLRPTSKWNCYNAKGIGAELPAGHE